MAPAAGGAGGGGGEPPEMRVQRVKILLERARKMLQPIENTPNLVAVVRKKPRSQEEEVALVAFVKLLKVRGSAGGWGERKACRVCVRERRWIAGRGGPSPANQRQPPRRALWHQLHRPESAAGCCRRSMLMRGLCRRRILSRCAGARCPGLEAVHRKRRE